MMNADNSYSHNSSVASGNHELPLNIFDPWMEVIDLDTYQWIRLYDLLIKPRCFEKGLYILHEKGHILSVTPKLAINLLDIPEFVENPVQLSKKLYHEWSQGPVVMVNRQRWNVYLDKIQYMFTQDDDILSYLIKIKNSVLTEGKDCVVIFPHSPKPWKLISPDIPAKLMQRLAPIGTSSTMILAIYEGSTLWCSVLFGLRDRKIRLITCVPSYNGNNDWRENQTYLSTLAEKRFAPITLGIICQRELAESLGFSPDSWSSWKQALDSGDVVCIPDKEKIINLIKDVGL